MTRNNKPVRIVCWDKLGDYPIIGCIKYSDDYEDLESYNSNGFKYSLEREDQNDLFFANEEKCNKILNELKSYLKSTPKEQVEKDWKEIQDWYSQHFTNEKYNEEDELTELQKTLEEDCDCYVNLYNDGKEREELREWIKGWCPRIIDLARKEIEKSIEEGTIEFAKSYMEDVNPSFEKVKESEELWKWKMSCLRGINKAYSQGKQEALKDLPKWKKTVQDYYHQGNIPCTNPTISGDEEYLIVGTYEIKISDLKALPKEE